MVVPSRRIVVQRVGIRLASGCSPLLFHGPSSQNRATVVAATWGRIVGVFGDPNRGLDIDTARSAADAARTVFVGDGATALVIGPVDLGTSAGVVDPLLKVLEEPDARYPRVHLWAWDEGEVRPTIRSRCLSEWCPGRYPVDGNVAKVARLVVQASVSNNVGDVMDAMVEIRDDWKDVGVTFLRSIATEIAGMEGVRGYPLWMRVRDLVGERHVTWQEALAGVLP